MFFDPIFAMVFLHFWEFHCSRDLMTHSGIETQWGWYKLWHEKHSILGNLQRQKIDTEMLLQPRWNGTRLSVFGKGTIAPDSRQVT